jgi:asparagine synthase (glutamine-hydrolysing)
MERVDRWAPAWSRHLAASLLDSRFLGVRRDRKICAWLRHEDGYGHPFFLSRFVFTPRRVAKLLQPDWLLGIDYGTYGREWSHTRELLEAYDPVNRVACLELSTYLRNMLLRDTDCMSMAHSLEVRVPLIDHVLVEKMMRLPGTWKLDGSQRKPLLVGALSRPLPADILRQPKRGFEFPWNAWLRGELRSQVEETLREPGALEPVLRWEQVRRLWNEFVEGRVHWSRVWMFYVLRQWTGQHIV